MKGGVKSERDDCIKIWVYFNSLHPELSEIFELLFGSADLYTARVDTKDQCIKDINYNILNNENIGSKCPNSNLCNDCKDFKKPFCSTYHIVGPKPHWIDCIKKKFGNTSLHWLSEEIIVDIAKYSSYDVEVELRNIYEQNYVDCVDIKHENYKDLLKSKSIMFKDNLTFLSTNYWFKLIFKVIVLNINKNPIEKYNQFTSEKNKHVNTNVINNDKNKEIKRYLDSKGIFYSMSNLNIIIEEDIQHLKIMLQTINLEK